jgi:hypothetical protein
VHQVLHQVMAVNRNGVVSTLNLRATDTESQSPDCCRLQIDGSETEYSSWNFFYALLELRRGLEQDGIQLLCAGARVDLWPSHMGLDMGRGLKGYVNKIGEQAKRETLIGIFESSERQFVGSVQQQSDFHENWLAFFRDRTAEDDPSKLALFDSLLGRREAE